MQNFLIIRTGLYGHTINNTRVVSGLQTYMHISKRSLDILCMIWGCAAFYRSIHIEMVSKMKENLHLQVNEDLYY